MLWLRRPRRRHRDSKKVNDRRFDVQIDESRDANLTEFGKETLTDRYLAPRGEVSGPVRARRRCLCR